MRRTYLVALGSIAITFAALGALFLLPYRVNDFDFPVGYDSLFYVWRANVAAAHGLDPIGTVRSGTPLLMATLMGLTGQNGFTIVTVVPAILAGIAGLGAAAMVRSSLGVGPVWIPVLAVMSWVGFGRIGMIGGHHDNVLNAALVLPAFAAACAAVAGKRGSLAVAALLAGAGLAHWAFYLYAAAIFLLGLAIYVALQLRSGDRALAPAARLLAAAGGSGALSALTFLAPPPQGGVGINVGAEIGPLLRERFLNHLRWPSRYLAVPLAVGGALLAPRERVPAGMGRARRLFLSLLTAWALSVLAGGILQLLGVPVAAARLMNYFFALPLLAGFMLVWGARWLARRGRPGVAAAAFLLLLGLGTFGAIAWQGELARQPWVEPVAVQEVAAAGVYLSTDAPQGPVVFLLSPRVGDRPWRRGQVIRASLPPDQAPRATWVEAPLGEFLEDGPGASGSGGDDRVVIVLRRYNRVGFRDAVATGAAVPAPGVAVLQGPPAGIIRQVTAPKANTSLVNLVWTGALVSILLLVAGSGWAAALLPPDPVLRVMLAPALGAALLVLVGLGWDRLGLGLGGVGALGPFALTVLAGWAPAVVLRLRPGGRGGPAEEPARSPTPAR